MNGNLRRWRTQIWKICLRRKCISYLFELDCSIQKETQENWFLDEKGVIFRPDGSTHTDALAEIIFKFFLLLNCQHHFSHHLHLHHLHHPDYVALERWRASSLQPELRWHHLPTWQLLSQRLWGRRLALPLQPGMAWRCMLPGWDTSGCTGLLQIQTTGPWNPPTSSFCPFSVVQVKFPRFYGYSHMTLEPLKNSYQTFQITVEFKVGFPHPFGKGEQEFCSFFYKFVFCTGWEWGRLVAVLRRERTRPWRLHLPGSGARKVALQVNHMDLMYRRLINMLKLNIHLLLSCCPWTICSILRPCLVLNC